MADVSAFNNGGVLGCLFRNGVGTGGSEKRFVDITELLRQLFGRDFLFVRA